MIMIKKFIIVTLLLSMLAILLVHPSCSMFFTTFSFALIFFISSQCCLELTACTAEDKHPGFHVAIIYLLIVYVAPCMLVLTCLFNKAGKRITLKQETKIFFQKMRGCRDEKSTETRHHQEWKNILKSIPIPTFHILAIQCD